MNILKLEQAMTNHKTITIEDALKMGGLSFKNGLPEVPDINLGFLQLREFQRGWNTEYFKNLKDVKEKENKKSRGNEASAKQI